jgi:hypothetical protein
MSLLKKILFGLAAFSVLAVLLIFSSLSPDMDKKDKNLNLPEDAVQRIRIPKIPQNLDFAGEPVPLSDTEVRERIDREILAICFWHSSIIQNIKFSRRYFPVIEELAKKHGIPDDFKYLAVTESSLRNATSVAGAKGIWQFMPETAESYNLFISKEIDERYNFYKASDAACQLLKRLKDKFGSWTLAAAAYNCGEGRVKERMSEQGGATYYDLVLPEETMRYVPRIIAMKEVMKNPARYGYALEESDYYEAMPKYKKVLINSSISHWPDFCKEHNITYKTLTVHNPWILGYSLNNSEGREFEVLIPAP